MKTEPMALATGFDSAAFDSIAPEAGLSKLNLRRNATTVPLCDLIRKNKSRFMNLGPLFNWGTMMLYHLNTPSGDERKEIRLECMEHKLGWLHVYARDLDRWNRCQEVRDLGCQRRSWNPFSVNTNRRKGSIAKD